MNKLTQYFTEYFTDLTSNEWMWDLVGINLIIIMAYLFVFKYALSALTGVSFKDELANKDNPAFGITIAFSLVSFFIIMGAASTGSDRVPLGEEILLMSGYGLGGMVMLFISKLLLDNIAMRSFCIQEQIRNRNVAAAIIDGSNVLATAIIIFSYMSWVKGTSIESILLVAFCWIMSQVLLTGISFLRSALFKSKDNITLQDSIKNGNIAVAIRYSSYKIAFGLTVLAASEHYQFEIGGYDNLWLATAIFMTSVLLAIAVKVLTWISKVMIFGLIDFADEINDQKNTGLAVCEAMLVIGITLAIKNLLL